MNPNIRPRDPSLKEAYRENFAAQLEISELVVMAHTDLGCLFDPQDCFETNLDKFKESFPNFKGIAVITRGEEGPLILDMGNGKSSDGAAPLKIDGVVSAVGAGDSFSGGLFAELLAKLTPGKKLEISDVKSCIPVAHEAAARHIRGEVSAARRVCLIPRLLRRLFCPLVGLR